MYDIIPSHADLHLGGPRRRRVVASLAASALLAGGAAVGYHAGADRSPAESALTALPASASLPPLVPSEAQPLVTSEVMPQEAPVPLAPPEPNSTPALTSGTEMTSAQRKAPTAAPVKVAIAAPDTGEAAFNETKTRSTPVLVSAPSPAVDPQFDTKWAVAKAEDVIEDISDLDVWMQDGIQASSRLMMLGQSFGRLADAGVPPDVDAAAYLARLATLQDFAEQAAEEMRYSRTQASARYAVLRQETIVVLNMLNAAVGTDLRLP